VRRDRRGAVAAGIDWLARDIAELKVGLALGAGSARGFAHLGVLRVLERAGVPIDVLTGTSIGAVVGAGWACGHSLDHIAAQMSAVGPRMLHATLPFASLSGNGRLRTALRRLAGERRIEDLLLPFAAMAVDLATREPVALERGPLWEAVLASAAIPGIFPPVRRDGRMLIDGVVRDPVPAGAAARLGGDVIIGVRLAPTREGDAGGTPPPPRANLLDIILTTVDVMQEAIESHGSRDAHLIIHPAVARVTMRQFEAGRALIAAGEAAAEEMLPALRGLLPWLQGGCGTT
jgi:NTE family protein